MTIRDQSLLGAIVSTLLLTSCSTTGFSALFERPEFELPRRSSFGSPDDFYIALHKRSRELKSEYPGYIDEIDNEVIRAIGVPSGVAVREVIWLRDDIERRDEIKQEWLSTQGDHTYDVGNISIQCASHTMSNSYYFRSQETLDNCIVAGDIEATKLEGTLSCYAEVSAVDALGLSHPIAGISQIYDSKHQVRVRLPSTNPLVVPIIRVEQGEIVCR